MEALLLLLCLAATGFAVVVWVGLRRAKERASWNRTRNEQLRNELHATRATFLARIEKLEQQLAERQSAEGTKSDPAAASSEEAVPDGAPPASRPVPLAAAPEKAPAAAGPPEPPAPDRVLDRAAVSAPGGCLGVGATIFRGRFRTWASRRARGCASAAWARTAFRAADPACRPASYLASSGGHRLGTMGWRTGRGRAGRNRHGSGGHHVPSLHDRARSDSADCSRYAGVRRWAGRDWGVGTAPQARIRLDGECAGRCRHCHSLHFDLGGAGALRVDWRGYGLRFDDPYHGGLRGIVVRHRAGLVAVLGLAGGFATPILMSTGRDNPIGLFGYVLLLDMGLLWLGRVRRWPWLIAMALLGTVFYEAGWVFGRMGPGRTLTGLVILGLFGLFFAFASRLQTTGSGSGELDPTLRLSQAGGVLAPFVLALYFAGNSDLGVHLYPVAILLVILSAAACWLGRLQQMPYLSTGRRPVRWASSRFGCFEPALPKRWPGKPREFAWRLRSCFTSSWNWNNAARQPARPGWPRGEP